MARCGCGGTCNCTVQGSGAFVITGSGDSGDPYIGSISTNPASPLAVSSSSSGLAVAGVSTASTNCITLSGNGGTSTPLTATPRLDPTGLLSCSVNGLRVDLPATATYPNAGRLIDVNGSYQISVEYPLVASASTTLTAASVNPNILTSQTISSGSATITNPSSTEVMLVQVNYNTHGIDFAMYGGTQRWTVSSSTHSQTIYSASTSASGMGFSIGSYAFKSGTIVSVAAGASYTATFTQTFIANSTTSSGSNAVTFTSGAINLVGWIK